MPILLKESIADVYYNKEPKKTKEIVKADQFSGVDDKNMSELVDDTFDDIDIYQNGIKQELSLALDDSHILDLRDIENTVCDYFIICDGTSNTQVNAIVNSVQKKVSKTLRDKPWHIEGSENAEWVLMDYVNVVVHVFQKHIREYYRIESLWGDAKITTIETKY